MREDDRNRTLVCAVAPERRILEGIQVAKGVIPDDLRDQAKKVSAIQFSRMFFEVCLFVPAFG